MPLGRAVGLRAASFSQSLRCWPRQLSTRIRAFVAEIYVIIRGKLKGLLIFGLNLGIYSASTSLLTSISIRCHAALLSLLSSSLKWSTTIGGPWGGGAWGARAPPPKKKFYWLHFGGGGTCPRKIFTGYIMIWKVYLKRISK